MTHEHLTAEDLAIYEARQAIGKAVALDLARGDSVDARSMAAWREMRTWFCFERDRILTLGDLAEIDATGADDDCTVRRQVEDFQGGVRP